MKEVFTKDALFANSKSRVVKGVNKDVNYSGKGEVKKVKNIKKLKYSKKLHSKTGHYDENEYLR